ncbi:fluoride efflux transporter FluC [Catenuloplanes sp. NPDC051500]|uniref:fluoride efflux transporter FluC n=1 Tax=Catenuloplanes sp. NPDC051500 TaxID=3363959 RepID=UPI0037AD190F
MISSRVLPGWPVIGAVAAGGALGAGTRYGVTLAWTAPWATVAVNVAGCLLIGVFLARLGERPLLRPFLTTGFCGGFTTYSTFAVQTLELSGRSAVLYVVATVAGAVGAAWLGGRLRA